MPVIDVAKYGRTLDQLRARPHGSLAHRGGGFPDGPDFARFAGPVLDSGEERGTITAAIDRPVSPPVLGAALYERFRLRGGNGFAGRALSAHRYQCGGHEERAAAAKKGNA
jgi:6-phosphogluconate dehydrogenase (decarboxylating)